MILYIDPGTGSMLFTILIGVLGALAYAFRNVFVKLRFVLSGGKRTGEDEHEYPYVIFTDSKRYWNVFQPICEEMERREQKLLYLTASADDPALEADFRFVRTEFAGEGNRAFARMNMIRADIVLSSTPSLDVYQWKRSRNVKWYVHIPHGMYDLTLYRLFGIDYYDAILMAGEYQAAPVRELEKLRNLPAKELAVAGMPYMDTMLRRYRAEEKREKDFSRDPVTVLLAPSWGESSILNRFGERIFDALLRTNAKVIVRPHPQSFSSEKALIDRLMAAYPESERMEWDRNDDNYPSLMRADILISDYSGIITDFAFVFEKPVIYADVSFNPKPYDASCVKETPWLFEVGKKLGVLLTQENVDRIGDVIRECLTSAGLKACIEQTRRESWQCIGESAARVADYLIRKREQLRGGESEAADGESPEETP